MNWPDDEPQELRLAEGHPRQDTAKVPGKRDGDSAGRPTLVDEQLADELLGKTQAEGVELLGPDGLLSQVTTAGILARRTRSLPWRVRRSSSSRSGPTRRAGSR